ncbi:uncharacterized protein [Palaemon carinicauda]|uniref:uncharacterized protein n=1 Tax=Palaemon carinicauda TaxID=392227 RepID=UPI0035B61790
MQTSGSRHTNILRNGRNEPLPKGLQHIVIKKDGSLYPWVDCRHLHMQTEPDYNSLPNIADMTSYLHKQSLLLLPSLYASSKGKPKHLKWGPLQEAAFCKVKNALSTTAALNFLLPPTSLLLSTNASNVPIGAILEHVAFFSRKLSKEESR